MFHKTAELRTHSKDLTGEEKKNVSELMFLKAFSLTLAAILRLRLILSFVVVAVYLRRSSFVNFSRAMIQARNIMQTNKME